MGKRDGQIQSSGLKHAAEIARHAADAQDYHHAYFTLAKAVEEFLRQSDGR